MTLRSLKNRRTTRPITRKKDRSWREALVACAAGACLALGTVAHAEIATTTNNSPAKPASASQAAAASFTNSNEPLVKHSTTADRLKWRAKSIAGSSPTSAPMPSDVRSVNRIGTESADGTANRQVAENQLRQASPRRHPREVLEPQVLETLNQVTREAPVVSQAAHEDEINISGEPTLAPRLMPSSPVSRFAQLPSGRNLTTPRFDEAFTRDTQTLKVDCDAERAKLKNISKLTATITPEPGDFPPECGPKEEQYYPRDWCMLTYTWKASNLCHKPLYFEDVQAERYGHVWPRPLQPFVSGGLFFGTVVMLPYRMGIELPNECVYDLGYYRPGSCAPYQIPGFPISLRGALFECGAVAVGLATVPGTAGLTAAQAAAAANGRVLIIP